MSNLEHGHHTHSNPESDHATPEHHPATKRERRGWPFWVALVLALVALAFYTLTNNLGRLYRGQPPQPVPTVTGK